MKQLEINLNEYISTQLTNPALIDLHRYFEEYDLNETFFLIVDAILVS